MIFWSADNEMNNCNGVAIFLNASYGIAKTLQNREIRYKYGSFGIRNIQNYKLRSSEDIQQIAISDKQIAIHTTRYRLDLISKSKDVKSPKWEKICHDMQQSCLLNTRLNGSLYKIPYNSFTSLIPRF